MDEKRKLDLLNELVERLCAERDAAAPQTHDAATLWNTFRALVNTRPPIAASPELLAAQDELLQGMIAEAGIHDISEAKPAPADPRLAIWRGDITTLRADAIVNAANSQMLGCWAPGHYCIDNAIHTFAGIQLRLECAALMEAQGCDEATGQAKITGAYNLPARHVIHTVGPIANGHPSELHREQLASCYRSCLDAAAENSVRSIAFCCISTGVFGFPQDAAAKIAVAATRTWLDETGKDIAVAFNVFTGKDEAIYRQLLS